MSTIGAAVDLGTVCSDVVAVVGVVDPVEVVDVPPSTAESSMLESPPVTTAMVITPARAIAATTITATRILLVELRPSATGDECTHDPVPAFLTDRQFPVG